MIVSQLSDDEARLLNDLSDDEYGLCEIKGARPYASLVPLLVKAIEAGYLSVLGGEFLGERRELPRDAAIHCITQLENWRHQEPPNEVFGVTITDLGAEALRTWFNSGLPSARG